MAKRVVGFIGLGLMGRGMAGNILRKGNDLLVMAHRNRAPIEELVAEGAREVKSPREMAAAADAIVICVTGSPEVEAVVRGESGILAGAKPGLLVINSSTADPVSTATLAAELQGGRRQPGRRPALAHAQGGGGRHARLHGRRVGRGFCQGESRSSNASPPRSCMLAPPAPATR